MKLFLYSNEPHRLISNDPFIKLIMKRLFIMEALASIKFKTTPIEDLPRESIIMNQLKMKCVELSYSTKKTTSILKFFEDNIHLAKCIQTACIQDWESLSIETVQVLGFFSSKLIMASSGKTMTNMLYSIREYINDATNSLFEALIILKKAPDFNAIINPLITCFPKINRIEINKIIQSMHENISALLLR